MFEKGLTFFKPRVVKGEGPSTPEPGRAEAFVAAAKGPQSPKEVKMVNGRPVYSDTPVMTDAEARAFRGMPNFPKTAAETSTVQNISDTGDNAPHEMAELVRGRITRAGKYFDLDDKVPTIGSRATEAQDSQSGFSDSTREALSLAEQKERYTFLTEEIAILEAELQATDEPLAWKEKNDILKPKRIELQALGKLLTDSAKTDQPN